MPIWFEQYLQGLNAQEKAELGIWLINPDNSRTNDDTVSELIIAIGA